MLFIMLAYLTQAYPTRKANILNNHLSSLFTIIENVLSTPPLDESPYPDIQPII